MTIALDAQGAEVARPFLEEAGATYPALLDQHNVIGKGYHVKTVPVGILVDEAGKLVRAVQSVNIDDDTFRRELVEWVTRDQIPETWVQIDRNEGPRDITSEELDADARFQLAIDLLDQGKRDDAIHELKRAFRIDPENWLIRKQLWAIEHPGAFYDGAVDYNWQKEQIKREQER